MREVEITETVAAGRKKTASYVSPRTGRNVNIEKRKASKGTSAASKTKAKAATKIGTKKKTDSKKNVKAAVNSVKKGGKAAKASTTKLKAKGTGGRGNPGKPKSAAHKAAISEAMRKAWAKRNKAKAKVKKDDFPMKQGKVNKLNKASKTAHKKVSASKTQKKPAKVAPAKAKKPLVTKAEVERARSMSHLDYKTPSLAKASIKLGRALAGKRKK